jgi:hypothetical protein
MNFREAVWGEGCAPFASDSGQRQVAVSCEHGNEPAGSMKGEEFLR